MKGQASAPIPRNIKETVSSMRAAVQEGLRAQRSRMDVDLPFAAKLGVEIDEGKSSQTSEMPSTADLARSDRELARLFVDMFDVIGDQVVVAFPTEADAREAMTAWAQGPAYKGKVTSMNPKQEKRKARGRSGAVVGFAAKVQEEGKAGGGKQQNRKGSSARGGGATSLRNRIVPPGTEVFIVVGPKQPELQVVQRLSKELGQGCLIVLLNARLYQANFFDDGQKQFFDEEFDSVFHLRPLGTETDDFVYRTFPKDWTVARKPKIGPPKVLITKPERPSLAEIRAAVEQGNKATGIFGNLF